MKSKLEHYVKSIVNQTECSREEKEDLAEELMSHLVQGRDELIKEGVNQKDAELKAIELFGSELEIGNGLQHALFPFRKEFMLTLSFLSLTFTIGSYLLLLLLEGDAYIGWLVLSIGISSLILVLTVNGVPHLNRKRWMNSILIVHAVTYLYGYGMISSMEHVTSIPFVIINWVIILLTLILIYQTTVNDGKYKGEGAKDYKLIHRLNMAIGLVIIGLTLFGVWVSLFFFDGFHFGMLIMITPLTLWIISYIVQMKVIHKSKRMALSLWFGSVAVTVIVLLFLFFPSFS